MNILTEWEKLSNLKTFRKNQIREIERFNDLAAHDPRVEKVDFIMNKEGIAQVVITANLSKSANFKNEKMSLKRAAGILKDRSPLVIKDSAKFREIQRKEEKRISELCDELRKIEKVFFSYDLDYAYCDQLSKAVNKYASEEDPQIKGFVDDFRRIITFQKAIKARGLYHDDIQHLISTYISGRSMNKRRRKLADKIHVFFNEHFKFKNETECFDWSKYRYLFKLDWC